MESSVTITLSDKCEKYLMICIFVQISDKFHLWLLFPPPELPLFPSIRSSKRQTNGKISNKTEEAKTIQSFQTIQQHEFNQSNDWKLFEKET